eukprot:gene24431-29705_t
MSTILWVNVPLACCLVFIYRQFARRLEEVETRRRGTALDSPFRQLNASSSKLEPVTAQVPQRLKPTSSGDRDSWKNEVCAPSVEAAWSKLNKSICQEFIVDLWYHIITPDPEAPEDLERILNVVFAELSTRAKKLNLAGLLLRDTVDIISEQLDLFRQTQAKLDVNSVQLSSGSSVGLMNAAYHQELKKSGRLHPALLSADSERQA